MPSTAVADDGTTGTADPKRRVCFSFAAYAKAVIDHLRSCGVPVTAGLSDPESTAIESSYGFSFPPDLRSILMEGLPVGPGFPNWRSASPQQLRMLLNLPIAALLNEVSKGGFWCEGWGHRPVSLRECADTARAALERSPPLVPIYRHFYIPSVKPDTNGNPIFYVRGGEVKCWALDIADFFSRFDTIADIPETEKKKKKDLLPAPAWAAKSARRVEVWSDLAGKDGTGGEDTWLEMGLRLREGGWREEEVKEMLATDGGDLVSERAGDRTVLRDRESVMWHVRVLALALLRAGWSTEDVVYAMGSSGSANSSPSALQLEQDEPAGAGSGNEISIEL